MVEMIVIGCFSALVVGVAAFGWIRNKRGRELDRVYHDALHAESIGDYDLATQLYRSILERFGSLIDSAIRAHIRSRVDTLRHQQEYMSQWKQAEPAPEPRSALS